MGDTKTVAVYKEDHKKLHSLKLEQEFDNIAETVRHLLKQYEQDEEG